MNRVPELVAAKFGGKDKVNLTKVQRDTKLNYRTVYSWVKGTVTRFDVESLSTWCNYLDASVGEILVYVPDPES